MCSHVLFALKMSFLPGLDDSSHAALLRAWKAELGHVFCFLLFVAGE